MSTRSRFSAQTLSVLSVLAALCDEPSRWHLHRLTPAGLASATGALASTAGSAAEPAAVQAGARPRPPARGTVAGVVP